MVVTVAKATSADYYTGGGGITEGVESYYLDAVTEGEPAGKWSGSGAARLGLEGEVTPEDMSTVYTEFVNPVSGEQIGFRPAKRQPLEERIAAALAAEPDALPERVDEIRSRIERSERSNVIGWDATFSVQKSVTVAHTAAHRAELAAIRSGDHERAARFGAIRIGIEQAIDTANTAMIGYTESVVTVRTAGGAGAPTQWVGGPGVVVASFFQHTSREIDPQLHVHNVYLNRTYTDSGRALAIDGQDFLAQQHGAGAVADRVLEEELTRMGFRFELRSDGMARELVIIDEQVCDQFSSRDEQVTRRVAELLPAAEEKAGRSLSDREIYRLKKIATKSTRRGKGSHPPETHEEMTERWWAELVNSGRDLDSIADDVAEHLDQAATEPAAADEWLRDAVIAEAVAAIGERQSAWGHADLMLELHRRLPSLGGLTPRESRKVLEDLAAEALAGPMVQQVSGHAADLEADAALIAELSAQPGGHVLAALEADPFTAPSKRLYAATGTLLAEEALRRAAIDRGALALDAKAVHAWLDTHAPTIGADQRAAVAGIAASDAQLCVMVGPAGTGKSYAAGTFAAAWTDLTREHDAGPGRVVGLAVSQIATQVLKDDGLADARNITKWLNAQDRLEEGSTHPSDTHWQLRASDVVMVDEASMVATADLHRIQQLAEAAGARVVLTGDPRQLGAVEAGGVMGLLDGHAETYTLSDVRRFTTEWESAASLALRDGDPDALAVYDRHGRLTSHLSTGDATAAAARAAVADRLDGRSVVVVTGTNKQAAAIATTVRDQLIELGLVDADGGVLLGRDGCTASPGDLIAARRNDYTLGVTNRGLYQVTETNPDGGLTVIPADRDSPGLPGEEVDQGAAVLLPPSYVADDVQLGYASTAHAAQGLTVDAAHLVTDGDLDASGLYVGLTRGRIRNTAHVALGATTGDSGSAPAAQSADGSRGVRFDGHDQRGSARAVLQGCLDRDVSGRAATVEAELDAQRLSSMALLSGRVEALTRAACRERLDRHLDQLNAEGVLDEDTRARLGADQGTENLSRVLRATEQAGSDPLHTLREAITSRSLGSAASPAQVLSHRITAGRPLPLPTIVQETADAREDQGDEHHQGEENAIGVKTRTAGRAVRNSLPSDIAPQAERHLTLLTDRITTREQQLGRDLAEQPPEWALDALGPVPGADDARAEWAARAGTVAAHREATGWDHATRPIGAMPGLSSTERRASYARAWNALGQPETGLDATALTEGQLRIRVRAAHLEQQWAPPHADAALRATEQAAEKARQDAAIARAAADHATRSGDRDAADRFLADAQAAEDAAAVKAAAIGPLTEAAKARAEWAAAVAVTLDEAARARAELDRRGITIDTEPDRTTDWRANHQQDNAADDGHRPITEDDLASGHEVHAGQFTDEQAATPAVATNPPQAEAVDLAPSGGDGRSKPADAGDEARTEAADQGDEQHPARQEPQPVKLVSSPAHQRLPEDLTPAEIEQASAVAALAMARARDRASQDAAAVSSKDEAAATAADSYDAGRRRRETADHDSAQVALDAYTLDSSHA